MAGGVAVGHAAVPIAIGPALSTSQLMMGTFS